MSERTGSECDRLRPMIEELLADELNSSDRRTLDQHISQCPECRALIDLHQQLAAMQGVTSEPAPAEFRAMRNRVLAAASGKTTAAPRRAARPTTWWMAGSMIATAATLVIGIFVGRMTVDDPALNDRLLLNTVIQQANANHDLGDYWDRPLSYANVSTSSVRNGQVHLDFSVCSRLDVNTHVDSSLARELLTHAVLDSDSIGERLRAIEAAGASDDPQLIEALAVAVENDPNVAIRIEALNALAGKASTPRTQAALLKVLRQDQSVQIRLMALESLAGHQVSPEQLSKVIVEGNQDSDRAVLQRAFELRGENTPPDWL